MNLFKGLTSEFVDFSVTTDVTVDKKQYFIIKVELAHRADNQKDLQLKAFLQHADGSKTKEVEFFCFESRFSDFCRGQIILKAENGGKYTVSSKSLQLIVNHH